MLTESNSTTTAASFSTASKESDFGKVFQNNMDQKSFNSDFHRQIELMILNGKTAFYTINDMMADKKEYRNCEVNTKYNTDKTRTVIIHSSEIRGLRST